MKRLRVTVLVKKTVIYEYNPLYRSEDAAIDKAYDEALECIKDGEHDFAIIEDVEGEDLEPEIEEESA